MIVWDYTLQGTPFLNVTVWDYRLQGTPLLNVTVRDKFRQRNASDSDYRGLRRQWNTASKSDCTGLNQARERRKGVKQLAVVSTSWNTGHVHNGQHHEIRRTVAVGSDAGHGLSWFRYAYRPCSPCTYNYVWMVTVLQSHVHVNTTGYYTLTVN